jgi:ribonuclease PH
MNVVMTETGEFIEIQGTGEESTYSRKEFNALLDLAEKGCNELLALQKDYLDGELP